MVEIHCFITLRADYSPYSDNDVEMTVPVIQKFIDNIPRYGIEIKAKNGEYYIEFSHFTNHLGSDFKDLFGFFENVGKIASGSYGLFYLYDDEDKTENNAFQVWRLAKGEVTKFKDTLLSPFVPTVEDIYTVEQFPQYLERYTKYQNGNSSCKCELIVQNTTVDKLDFSPYDLGGSLFLGVNFNECLFKDVYMSGSNFGGSTFNRCILKNNTLRKSNWDNTTFTLSTIHELDAFRTEFDNSIFSNSTICDSKLFKCSFFDSELNCTAFANCEFERVYFKDCKFDRVTFKNCTFKDTEFDDELCGVQFDNCKTI